MHNKNTHSWPRKRWFGLAALTLITLMVLASVPSWAAPVAAPLNQTVPQPTATSGASTLPTATPSNNDDDDDDDDDASPSQPDPTATPVPDSAGGAGAAVGVPASEAGLTGEITVARLNVREGPGTSFAVIGTVVSGDVVGLLGRSADGGWWAICCVGPEGRAGWASAQFIRPSIGRIDANNALPVITDLTALAAQPAPAADAVDDAANTADETPSTNATPAPVAEATTPATELRLEMMQSPPYVLQGGYVEIDFVVTNVGDQAAQAVALTNQLPQGLTFVSGSAADGGELTEQAGAGGSALIVVQWPTLAAGESASASVTLAVSRDLPPGAVVDNLAAAAAENADSSGAGVSIGTVPNLLPNF